MRRTIRTITLVFFFATLTLYAGAQSATITDFYSLNTATDGSSPYGNLVQGPDGNYYGTAAKGGVNDDGTIFRVTPTGVYTTLYSFQGSPDGQNPQANLFLASDGYLYGTAAGGGQYSEGTVFRISTTGTFTLLYTFTGGTDGGFPASGVIEGSDGNLYGTTASGGAINAAGFTGFGTIFEMTPNGVLTTLHTFTGGDTDGSTPYANLVEGSDGNLYGTTNSDEVGDTVYEAGSVFKVSKTGTFTTLYHFAHFGNGTNPDGGLVEGPDASFYGSTHNGGLYADDDDDSGQGTIYKVSPDGTFQLLYQFTGHTDSGHPEGTLTFASDGNLYGTTTNSPSGTLFQLTPSGSLTTLARLSSSHVESLAGPIVGSDGNLYGTTANGGTNGSGSIFQAVPSMALTPLVQLTLSSSTVAIGNSVQLNWQVTNAFSATAQRCVATVQNGTGGGMWAGPQTGSLSGNLYSGSTQITPTAIGTYTYALTCGGTISGFATLTVPAMQLTTVSLPDATVGSSYLEPLAQQNGLAPFTWKVTEGSLPVGLSLDASTGDITGTPTAPGVSSFTVQVTDSENVPVTATAHLSIVVASSSPTLNILSTTLNVISPGATASTGIVVSGFASNAFTFSCAGLPAKAQCLFSSVTGTQAYGTATLQVVTDGGLTAQMHNHTQPGMTARGLSLAALPGLLAVLGLARKRRKHALRLLAVTFFTAVLFNGLLTGCSDSSSSPVSTDATPRGTSTVTVTATAGDQHATATFTLQVQ